VPARKVTPEPPRATIEEVPTTPEMIQAFEQGERNANWFNEHAQELEVFTRYRGKDVAVAGCELFVADSAPEAVRLARAKYPGECVYLRYIPKEKSLHRHAY
jgi:hypothetical protein